MISPGSCDRGGAKWTARRIAFLSVAVSSAVLAASVLYFVAAHRKFPRLPHGGGDGGGDGSGDSRRLTDDHSWRDGGGGGRKCSPDDYLSQAAAVSEGCREAVRPRPRPVVDVLSIGSLERLGFLERQRAGWASDDLVRYFWGASELDDARPACAAEVEMEDVVDHAMWCHRAPRNSSFAEEFYKREEDPFGYVMKRKGNVPGWFCAQRRQGQSLARVGAMYRNLTVAGGNLPDYLLLVDDDTYVNLPLLAEHLDDINTNVPLVYAGCLFPKKISFPFGGFGLFYSKGAIARMIRPIYCRDTARGFEADVCNRLREDLMGERSMFQPGMSISDLMAVFSASDKLCMHSDWVTGYFVNIYGLSRSADAAPMYQRFGYDRIHALAGTKFGNEFKKHVQNHCSSDSALVCHKVTPHPGETEADALAKEQGVSATGMHDSAKVKATK
eukprot:CAMPEP_0113535882 /NCGR_PEP_ID=MMETSP0015_2-20120614/5953_1 /TAXON_ID=2838 /ORGANISM="Odontella" /LENGTH=442 /DNA_ID=CAMNT_0000435187 /DNA_START=2604 /DNA_END=3932 /DNA_ORIENTATION=- /assembly_acc=CAM_ASM_000160